jgi:hypothetical protein
MSKNKPLIKKLLFTVLLMAFPGFLLDACNTSPGKYNGIHNQFVPVGRMVAHRSGHHGFLLSNGEVLLLGGNRSERTRYAYSTEIYNPNTGQFRPSGNLLSTRSHETATMLQDGRILIAGSYGVIKGKGQEGGCLRLAEIYDPKTAQSHFAGNLNQCRSSHQATLLNNGKVLITGGVDYPDPNNKQEVAKNWKQGGPELSSTELYDPETETFTLAAPMLAKRTDHQATLLQDGNVLVTGGSFNLKALDSAELYLSRENRFIPLPRMIYPRVSHRTEPLSNRNVVIVGGQTTGERAEAGTDGNVIRQVEQYNFKKRHFEPVGFLNIKDFVAGVTLLKSGKILTLTGAEEAEIYNPKTQISTQITNRRFRWNNDSSVRLLNGDVLITAGNSRIPFDFSPVAEIYKF